MVDDVEGIDDSVLDSNVIIEQQKKDARKLSEELRKKSVKFEAVVITKDGEVKGVNSLTIEERYFEIAKCASDPIYFIETYLTIFDQTQGDGGLIVPFKLFSFQKKLIKAYQNHQFNIANKYRQAGISTTTCAYIAWYIMFIPNRTAAIVADKLETARDELMNDVIMFIEGCPDWLRPKTGKDVGKNAGRYKDTQKLKRYDNGSELGAFSSRGLRGTTPTLLFWDETAWTENSGKFWTAAYPTLQTGGSAIMVSTPSGLDEVFYKTFTLAREGKNDFNAVELWWFNDPRYNKGLVWFKDRGKENELKLIDEGWDEQTRIDMMDDGWVAASPWFDRQVANANGNMRKIAQELLCVFGDSIITVRNKLTGQVEDIKIEDFYIRLKEQNNATI